MFTEVNGFQRFVDDDGFNCILSWDGIAFKIGVDVHAATLSIEGAEQVIAKWQSMLYAVKVLKGGSGVFDNGGLRKANGGSLLQTADPVMVQVPDVIAKEMEDWKGSKMPPRAAEKLVDDLTQPIANVLGSNVSTEERKKEMTYEAWKRYPKTLICQALKEVHPCLNVAKWRVNLQGGMTRYLCDTCREGWKTMSNWYGSCLIDALEHDERLQYLKAVEQEEIAKIIHGDPSKPEPKGVIYASLPEGVTEVEVQVYAENGVFSTALPAEVMQGRYVVVSPPYMRGDGKTVVQVKQVPFIPPEEEKPPMAGLRPCPELAEANKEALAQLLEDAVDQMSKPMLMLTREECSEMHKVIRNVLMTYSQWQVFKKVIDFAVKEN